MTKFKTSSRATRRGFQGESDSSEGDNEEEVVEEERPTCSSTPQSDNDLQRLEG
jgi:hypothetical protein